MRRSATETQKGATLVARSVCCMVMMMMNGLKLFLHKNMGHTNTYCNWVWFGVSPPTAATGDSVLVCREQNSTRKKAKYVVCTAGTLWGLHFVWVFGCFFLHQTAKRVAVAPCRMQRPHGIRIISFKTSRARGTFVEFLSRWSSVNIVSCRILIRTHTHITHFGFSGNYLRYGLRHR